MNGLSPTDWRRLPHRCNISAWHSRTMQGDHLSKDLLCAASCRTILTLGG